jgi:hypothetical protein
LLRESGIDVRLSNGRSYHSKRSGQFSYLEKGNAQTHPTVWIVHANDQPRAREILREARLLDTTRHDLPSAQYTIADLPGTVEQPRANWTWRIRITLLLVIGVVALFIALRHRAAQTQTPPPPAPAATTAPVQPQPPAQQDQEEIRVRIEPAK